VFIITDLTEKKEIEETLQQREHLALIGEMAAGIAHEIRNPLASISGSVQFLKKELTLGPEYKNLMDIIVKESHRLSMSIEEFLEFTHNAPLDKKDLDVSTVVDEIIELLALNHQDIKFVRRYNNGHYLNGDPKKIKQLIWNLVNNAVKAVTGIERDKEVEVAINEEDSRIFLYVKDNGIGIDRAELDKIFTPFYSKFTSGIGLGMPMVKRIVQEHQGDIKIKSKKNIGTEVKVCFSQN
jgi:two-component system sensor histidine kinase PilS (NtrC family)